jgi:hypothetical protein
MRGLLGTDAALNLVPSPLSLRCSSLMPWASDLKQSDAELVRPLTTPLSVVCSPED